MEDFPIKEYEENYYNQLQEEDLSKYEGDDKIVSSIELKEELKDKYKNIICYKTKFPTLNEFIGGFTRGEVTVISGITKNGKTLFCQTLTKHFADNGDGSLWFTYEIPVMQFLAQFGENLPHFYMPKILKDKNLDWIYTRIKEAIVKYDIKFVFIDHLHFLADIIMKSNPSLEIGRIMRTLKRWALDLNIIIFIVAHTMKINTDRELQAGDIRDSSFVEQESDNTFYIWRARNVDNGAILKIAWNRGRGIMNKKINLIKQGNYLVELNNVPSIEDLSNIEENNFGEEI